MGVFQVFKLYKGTKLRTVSHIQKNYKHSSMEVFHFF